MRRRWRRLASGRGREPLCAICCGSLPKKAPLRSASMCCSSSPIAARSKRLRSGCPQRKHRRCCSMRLNSAPMTRCSPTRFGRAQACSARALTTAQSSRSTPKRVLPWPGMIQGSSSRHTPARAAISLFSKMRRTASEPSTGCLTVTRSSVACRCSIGLALNWCPRSPPN